MTRKNWVNYTDIWTFIGLPVPHKWNMLFPPTVRTLKVGTAFYSTIHSKCLGILLGEGNGTLLQYSCLENPMDGEAWWATVHGVAKSRTRLSDITFTFHLHELEKEMATLSSVLAWRIPGKGKPGGLWSMGSRRVGHDWSDLAAAAGILLNLHRYSANAYNSKVEMS